MLKSIPGFCQNLNNQFFYDKCSDNGNPRKILLIYYDLSLGNDIFNHYVVIIKNGCEIILILLFKLGILVLLEAWIYLEKRNGCLFDIRYCKDFFHLFIMMNKRGGRALLIWMKTRLV